MASKNSSALTNKILSMKNVALVLLSFLLACQLAGCKNAPVESAVEEPAKISLDAVKAEIEKGNFNRAKSLIDSLRRTHPKAYKTLREAEELRHGMLVMEKQRDVSFYEKELERLTAVRDSVVAGYEYRKDPKFQDVGIYSDASQSLSKNSANCFLRATVNELGEVVLTSYYRGKRIGYKEVKVQSGGTYAVAEKSLDVWTGKEFGVYVERHDFKYDENKDFMEFIAASSGAVSVELLGGSSPFSYELRASDVNAIARILDLSDLLKAIVQYREELNKAKYSLQFLSNSNARHASPDAGE